MHSFGFQFNVSTNQANEDHFDIPNYYISYKGGNYCQPQPQFKCFSTKSASVPWPVGFEMFHCIHKVDWPCYRNAWWPFSQNLYGEQRGEKTIDGVKQYRDSLMTSTYHQTNGNKLHRTVLKTADKYGEQRTYKTKRKCKYRKTYLCVKTVRADISLTGYIRTKTQELRAVLTLQLFETKMGQLASF